MRNRCDEWLVGSLLCLRCGFKSGVHVYLSGAEPVECPECGEMACVPREEVEHD